MPYVKRRKKTSVALLVAVGIGVVTIMAVGIWAALHLMHSGRFESFDDHLRDLVARRSKDLPKIVSRGMREDAVSVGENHNFYFDYTLINTDASEIDAANLNTRLRPALVRAYTLDSRMENFRNHGEILHYRYDDKNGKQILEIVVGPKDMQQDTPPASGG